MLPPEAIAWSSTAANRSLAAVALSHPVDIKIRSATVRRRRAHGPRRPAALLARMGQRRDE